MSVPSPASPSAQVPAPRTAPWMRAVCAVAAAYPCAGGVLTLAGWVWDVPRLTAWQSSGIAMKVNPAICAMAGGIGVLILVFASRARALVRGIGVSISAIGLLTVTEHLFGVDLGIDTLLFDEPPGATATVAPGRMGPPASVSFSLLGLCLLLATGGSRARRVAAVGALVPIAIAALGMIGYLYRASQLYAVARFTGIALQTATMIASLALALTLALPEHGIVATLRRDDPGGEMFRRLLGPFVFVSVLLGALRLFGERGDIYDTAFGTAARTVIELVLIVGLLWGTAERIGRHALVAREAERALRESNRRKDEFLATLAHELRNPLAPLSSGLELIRTKTGDAAVVARTHAIMARQLRQMVHLVDDLLDISRISRGAIELRRDRIAIHEVVAAAVESSRSAIEGTGHALSVVEPEEPILVEGDLTRLTQVLSNLLNNAAKYTDPGGRIRLSVERSSGEAVIRVRDNGIGIPQEVGDRVFDMFTRVATTLDRSRGGLGIGLALVKSLVEMHGGRVEVRSPPPASADDPVAGASGSEFSVRLPCLPEEASKKKDLSAGSSFAAARDEPAAGRLRVLIADDNGDGAETLAMLISELGHETRTAGDGLEALSVGESFRPDVAIVDIGMPHLDGYEVARRMRAEAWGRQVLLVALTGWGQPEDRNRSREAGFDHHLVKPASPEILVQVLGGASRG